MFFHCRLRTRHYGPAAFRHARISLVNLYTLRPDAASGDKYRLKPESEIYRDFQIMFLPLHPICPYIIHYILPSIHELVIDSRNYGKFY